MTSGGGCSTAFAISWPASIKDKGGQRSQFTHLIDVVPTILEAAGVPAPKVVVNGVVQKPLDGVSMSYSFDDAKAMDRRTGLPDTTSQRLKNLPLAYDEQANH